MKRRGWVTAAPVVLIAAGGCLASKGDIGLLQDEMRATRSSLAQSDTSILRAEEARRAQIAALTTKIDHMTDSLRIMSARFAQLQATSNGEFDAIGQQMVSMQALLGQTTRNLQDTRAQLSAIREQGGMPAGGPPPVMPTTDANQAAAPGQPGASTLFLTAKDQLDNGAYNTARSGFLRLLTSYPASDQAPRALLYVGESFKGEGNTRAADSVYQLIPIRYPRTQEAATGMYRHGRSLWDTNNKGEARVVLNRVMHDYPNSDAAELARELLNQKQ